MHHRTPPTLEDLVDPTEECEAGDSPYRFGGDAKIVAEAPSTATSPRVHSLHPTFASILSAT